ncbi:MAG: hypothetical protein HQK49_17255 [Oligoflexia bacterium]|nr:hypothetical protein [Oligoflexia bacterium]
MSKQENYNLESETEEKSEQAFSLDGKQDKIKIEESAFSLSDTEDDDEEESEGDTDDEDGDEDDSEEDIQLDVIPAKEWEKKKGKDVLVLTTDAHRARLHFMDKDYGDLKRGYFKCNGKDGCAYCKYTEKLAPQYGHVPIYDIDKDKLAIIRFQISNERKSFCSQLKSELSSRNVDKDFVVLNVKKKGMNYKVKSRILDEDGLAQIDDESLDQTRKFITNEQYSREFNLLYVQYSNDDLIQNHPDMKKWYAKLLRKKANKKNKSSEEA